MSSGEPHPPRYDPDYVRRHYDEFGQREWARFEVVPGNRLAPGNQVNLHLHLWHLRRQVRSGDHVLDIGAGPGRFTIELARLGARVTVGDISPTQLELNRRKVQEAGYEAAVIDRVLIDVVDLSAFATNSFDAVVCYGGALSYTFDRADQAMGELLRVTRPGGRVLLSVMSLLGTSRRFLGALLELARRHGAGVVDALFASHDQIGVIAEGHRFRYYTWASLQALLARHPCTIIDASAANFLAIGNNEQLLEPLLHDPHSDVWDAYLAWEVECCRQPGAIDAGTHMIAVVQKRPPL
jgi:SAM-dependent methyltransferase